MHSDEGSIRLAPYRSKLPDQVMVFPGLGTPTTGSALV
jgi:hypothetical protein